MCKGDSLPSSVDCCERGRSGSVAVAFAEQDRAEQGRDGAGQGRRRPIEAIEVEATQGIREA